MANLLPLLLIGGAALVLTRKKKGTASAASLPPMVAPPTKGKSGTATWKKRQQSLEDAGYDIGKSGVDGKPGPDTREAIKEFQAETSITVDGKWGAQTSAAMAEALKMVAQGLGRAAYGQIGSMLEKFKDVFFNLFGDKEENVGEKTADLPEMVAPPTKGIAGVTTWMKRQQSLLDVGFDIGPSGVDGKPGPDTREAIREFQGAANITIDGKWGAQTSAAMAQALKMAVQGLGKAAYGQIGSMLDKFKSTFFNLFGDKEENVGEINLNEDTQLAAQILLELGYDSSEPSHIRRFQDDFNAWRTAWSKPANIHDFELSHDVESPAMKALIESAPKLSLNGTLDRNTRNAAADADHVSDVMAGVMEHGDWMDFIQFTRTQLTQA